MSNGKVQNSEDCAYKVLVGNIFEKGVSNFNRNVHYNCINFQSA